MSSSSPKATSTPMSSAPACSRPAAKLVLNLPPGFHFVPTDYELVVHYLRPRLANQRLRLPIFINERILDYHPDILIEKYRNYGEGRWFFFTARERKHLGGNRPNRTTPDNGHWNATGSIRAIRSAGGVLVGCRRTLVFYEASRSKKKKKNQQAAASLPPTEEEFDGDGGQAAKAAKDGVIKTDWTMYEYESLTSAAEFEAIRNGNVKMDVLLLCTIQKKKHSQEGGQRKKKKKSSKRKTNEDYLELEAEAAGDVEQSSHAGTTEGQDDEDHVQRALMEAAASEPQEELAYHAPAAGVDNFNNVDPDQNRPYYYLTNSLSSPVPMPTPPSQETLVALASGDNQIVMRQENYFFINHTMNMKNSQSFQVQETPPPQEFLPYLGTKMAAPRGAGINTMDHMLQNRFVNMTTPSQSQAPPVSSIGTYLNPRCSKSDVWEHSAELHGDKPNRPLKPENDWWSSRRQTKLPGRELDNPYYVTNSLSSVPAPQQETMMELAARGNKHTVMHQQNYLNHSSNMWNSQFHVQATLPQEEFLAYSSTTKQMAAPLGGGGSTVDHHMLQNRIVNVMPATAESHTFAGFLPSLSSSYYGHLSTRMDDHPGPSSVSFPSQQSLGAGSRTGMQGPLLNNQVNLNHQNSAAASMVGYEQRNAWCRFSTQDGLR